MPTWSKAVLSAAVAVAILAPSSAAAAVSPADCDLVAAPAGSDSAAGTAEQPLRSAAAVVGKLAAGQTGCFRTGTYTFEELNVRTARVTLTSFPDERAELKGQLRIERTATGAVLEDLLLNGINDIDGFSPLVYADEAIIRDNEITNEDTTNCVHLSTYYDEPAPADVIIEGNEIHNCGGHAPNHDHGIYIAESRNLIIRDNVIYDNADRGIQLWPNAQGTQVYGNIIDGNGQGVSFGGYEGNTTNHTVVENNIITNSNVRHNVESFWPEDTPAPNDNIVRNNCVYGADGWYNEDDDSGVSSDTPGFTFVSNVIADPGYVNRAAHDYTLTPGSPCAGVLEGNITAPLPISLEATDTRVPEGDRITLTGSVPSSARGGITILMKRDGKWRRAGHGRVKGTTFSARLRVPETSHFKARAEGALDSNAVKVAAVATKRKS